MRVGAIEYRGANIPVPAQVFLDLSGDKTRLGFRIEGLVIANLFARTVLGPESFFFPLDVMTNQAAGNIQNVLRRTVILFQTNDLRRRKMLFKLQNVGDVGAAPAIDRLIGVAYDADVLLLFREQTNQRELQRISVMILINQ